MIKSLKFHQFFFWNFSIKTFFILQTIMVQISCLSLFCVEKAVKNDTSSSQPVFMCSNNRNIINIWNLFKANNKETRTLLFYLRVWETACLMQLKAIPGNVQKTFIWLPGPEQLRLVTVNVTAPSHVNSLCFPINY